MKGLDYYLLLPYRMEIVPDTEGQGFVASYPDLPGCFAYGNTLEAAAAGAVKAKAAWLQSAVEDGITIFEPDERENYSGQFRLRIPRTLHKAIAEHAAQEGISMNQYCMYLLTMNDARVSAQKSGACTPRESTHIWY